MVIGDDNRAPTAAELERMKQLVRDAMHDGAVGVSTALQYAPAPYATTEELIALASEAGKLGGIYATHMRSEGDAEYRGDRRSHPHRPRGAHAGARSGTSKPRARATGGACRRSCATSKRRARAGVDIGANTYAYPAWFNTFSAFIPPWAHDGGDAKLIERLKDPATRARIRKDMQTPSKSWDNEWQEIPGPEAILVSVVQNPKLLPLQGKTIAEIAKLWGKDPIDTVLRPSDRGRCVYRGRSLRHVRARCHAGAAAAVGIDRQRFAGHGAGRHCWAMSIRTRAPTARSRAFCASTCGRNTSSRLKMRSGSSARCPRSSMRLADRGVLKQGMWADIVVFDPATIHDVATFEKPNQLSEGMEYVLVNGVPVISEGKMTSALPGKVLRGPAYRP